MNKLPELRISSASQEVPLQASKWLSSQMLINFDEMKALLDSLGTFYLYSTGSIVSHGSEGYSKEEFLAFYKEYAETLQNGQIPDEAKFRKPFSSVLTLTPDVLYSIPVENDKMLVRIAKPVVQLQAHRMDYSRAEGKFRSMTFGGDSITWGIQCSYPQLYQDGKTKEIHTVDSGIDCPNTPLFRSVQLWVRNNTIPTPFLVDGQKLHIPVRIGKQCLPWINNHPQLIKKGLQVAP